ncbi:glutamine deamidase [Aureococcus anophagefferens]|nr:glutamine deamidase [Aureococcus anophagefferens]
MGAAVSVDAVALTQELDDVLPKTPRGSPDVARCDRDKVMAVVDKAMPRIREQYDAAWAFYSRTSGPAARGTSDLLESSAALEADFSPAEPPRCALPPGATVEVLLLEASTHGEALLRGMERIASASGGAFHAGPRKKAARIAEKAAADYEGDVARVIDVERATVVFQSAEDFNYGISLARAAARRGDVALSRCKDRLPGVGGSGYRDLVLNMAREGFVGECQFTLGRVFDVKKYSHRIYSIARVLEGGGDDEALRRALGGAGLESEQALRLYVDGEGAVLDACGSVAALQKALARALPRGCDVANVYAAPVVAAPWTERVALRVDPSAPLGVSFDRGGAVKSLKPSSPLLEALRACRARGALADVAARPEADPDHPRVLEGWRVARVGEVPIDGLEDLREVLGGLKRSGAGPVDVVLRPPPASAGDVRVRLGVDDVSGVAALRDAVLLRQSFQRRLNKALGAAPGTVRVDRAAFVDAYARLMMRFTKLTPHQRQKLEASKRADASLLLAPAGGGKTFVAIQRMLEVLDAGGERVLFVARNASLAFFAAKWLVVASRTSAAAVVDRLRVLVAPFERGPRRLRATATLDGEALVRRLVDLPPSRAVAVCALSEVVRSTKRIVAGAAAFQLAAGRKADTLSHTASDGPPLVARVFAAPDDGVPERYAAEVVAALETLRTQLHGVNLDDRVAIVCPDDTFLGSSGRR